MSLTIYIFFKSKIMSLTIYIYIYLKLRNQLLTRNVYRDWHIKSYIVKCIGMKDKTFSKEQLGQYKKKKTKQKNHKNFKINYIQEEDK